MNILEIGMAQGIERGMAQGLEQGMTQGMKQGIEQGIQEGENRLVQLLRLLKNVGREEDAERAIFDDVYRKQLYEEYKMDISGRQDD